MLRISNITVRLGGRAILDKTSASIVPGSRVGLVGRNGAGKSTLMKVVAGILDTDTGNIQTNRKTSIGYIAQQAPAGNDSPFDRVLAADTERTQLMEIAENATDSDQIGETHERLNAIEAHAAPARVARILAGLGFDEEAQKQTLDSFSGGWRMRVAIAELLFSGPELLLLDEPSNHLDLEATMWLESFLKNYRGTLLLISHERDFLNNVVDHILHLEGGKVTLYTGGYDSFERQRSERLTRVVSMRVKKERQRANLQAFVDRWRYKAHSARQAQSRLKALERMEPIAASIEDPNLTFCFPSPTNLRPPLIVIDEVAVGYTENIPVLANLNLRLDPDDRVAFLGRNGNGKTTLARLLGGRLKPMSGSVNASRKLRVGYFAQHQVEELDTKETPIQQMSRLMLGVGPQKVREQLGRFGFSGDRAELPICNLSGGERARLALSLITRDAPHLLILDEPTNHLDVDAREALVQALNDYKGAVIIISHDRHLLQLTADRLVVVANGSATDYSGTLEQYKESVLNDSTTGPSKNKRPNQKLSRKDERRLAARQRENTKLLRKTMKDAERKHKNLLEERSEIDQALHDSKLYNKRENNNSIAKLMRKRSLIDQAIIDAESNWLKAVEALDCERVDTT